MPSHSIVTGRSLRQLILKQSHRAHVGHIGSALSIVDILAALFSSILRLAPTHEQDRDRFILSKGHAALALYATLFLRGSMTQKQLDSFCQDGSLLGVHPEHTLRGIDFSTGSLGQGLSMGTGAALAARLQNSSRKIFVLVSDAECNEGSMWEAATFAAHHKLSNLVVIVDCNGQQAFGYTRDVLDMSPMKARWQSFGWNAIELDGHNTAQLTKVISQLDATAARPYVIIAQTVFGKGVSFMENKIKWHYWPLSEEEYQQAMQDVERLS